jgi:hypothetical protein
MISNFMVIGQSLAKFQLIESFLKVYLVKCEITQDRIDGNRKEYYSVSKFVALSYPVLLKRYKKNNRNIELFDRLQVLKDYRDYLAHQAFVAGLDISLHMKQFIGINPTVIDYAELNKELDECITLLVQEYNFVFKMQLN